MRVQQLGSSLMAAALLTLCACGGGGRGTEVASTPPPPANPTPPPSTPQPTLGTILTGVTTSQQFAAEGGNVTTSSSSTGTLSTADIDQLKVRYDALTEQYQVQLPGSAAWEGLAGSGGTTGVYSTANDTFLTFNAYAANGYNSSALARWSSNLTAGGIAFGIPTAAANVPVNGSADFDGSILGNSTETINDAWGPYSAWIEGTIDLSFDFGAGTLSGSISPVHNVYDPISLPTLAFSNAVYSSGSTTFSGTFATGLPGGNSFSGQFTGPAAQELIGKFAFPYVSPLDDKTYTAGGAFVAKDH